MNAKEGSNLEKYAQSVNSIKISIHSYFINLMQCVSQ